MSFTRKHYVLVAEILKPGVSLSQEQLDDRFELAVQFADMFDSDNERFDRQLFMNACGIYAPVTTDPKLTFTRI